MATSMEALAEKGRRQPTRGTAQQVDYSLGLIAKYRQPLVSGGFTEAKITELETGGQKLHQAIATQQQTHDDAASKAIAEAQAIDGAKELWFKARAVVPIVVRDHGLPESHVTCLNIGKVGRSTPRLLEGLSRIRPTIETLDALLMPYFESKSPTALLDGLVTKLRQADQAQELARKSSPSATRELHVTKGRMLELIEDLNRVAAVAFYGRADLVGLFNKDILLRARRSPAGEAEPAPETEVA